MGRRLLALARHDMRMQWRYGIYPAYAFVVAMYAVILIQAGDFLPGWAVATIIYTDPAVLGMFFLGGMMMLEKSEAVRGALSMTPVSAAEYILSKMLTLGAFTLAAVLILGLLAHADDLNIGLLIYSVAMTSSAFISVGVLLALYFKTVSGYLMGSVPIVTPMFAPALLVLLDPYPLWANFLPTAAQFWLLLLSLGVVEGTTAQITLALFTITVTAVLMFVVANRRLSREFGSK